VIVRRELLLYNDYGHLFLEKLLLQIHPDAILDFDDDISAAKNEPRQISSLFGRIMLEHGSKFNASLGMFSYFIAGSDYLRQKIILEHSGIPAANMVVVPTCVDYTRYSPVSYETQSDTIRLGWIGGIHNLPLLQKILPDIQAVTGNREIELIVISGKPLQTEPAYSFTIVNKPWDMKTQVEDLKSIDIGLMPLSASDEDKGKAGFKLIQYMGLGIVSIASAVTVNNEIIDHGENGFLVYDENKWADTIQEVIDKRDQWGRIGKKARGKVLEHYTFDANKEKYLNFLRNE
jgi:glycosyltransferase involved in cell wall biosynthesis